ncbi:adenylate kinase [Besnoitia besnoiti]|uniref:Adenylate kinase n=1 Tax=Besnoitia besnoiti TaxID=94643 RepID=A0A2A9M2Y1_BESBE|nr:adenylate kinase [Besnoitia besnoiti]PFH31574.1 adenylate kinase [Besnoitia besnoiti]
MLISFLVGSDTPILLLEKSKCPSQRRLKACSLRRLSFNGLLQGSKRSQICDRLADSHDLIHIHAGRLIRAFLEKNNETLESRCIQNGDLVPDQIAIDAVIPAIRKHQRRGCIINGFPRTRVQAVAMQESRIVPDKFIVLQVPSSELSASFQLHRAAERDEREHVDSLLGVAADPEEVQPPEAGLLSSNQNSKKVQAYERHIASIMQQYCSAYHIIDSSAIQDETLRRIRIIGPRGSGKSTQAELLADWYGVVHFDALQIIRELAITNPTAREALRLAEEKGDLLPQDILLPVLLNRLRQADCAQRGWVLEGFPQTSSQAEWLRHARLTPTQLIALDVESVGPDTVT